MIGRQSHTQNNPDEIHVVVQNYRLNNNNALSKIFSIKYRTKGFPLNA